MRVGTKIRGWAHVMNDLKKVVTKHGEREAMGEMV